MRTKKQLNEELKRLRKEQVTDIYASFSTRIGRYVRIELIKYILNNGICVYIQD